MNVFDWKLHGLTLANKSEETVLVGMRKLLKKLGDDTKGGLLSSDLRREFKKEGFSKLLEIHDLAHKMKGNGE